MKELIWNELELVYINYYVIINFLEYSIYRECHQQKKKKRRENRKKKICVDSYRHKRSSVICPQKLLFFLP